MRVDFVYTLLLTFRYFCGISAWFFNNDDCTIPKGALYDRATFRLHRSYYVYPLARGQKVDEGQRVVVVCDTDIISDLINKYYVVTCFRGRWRPQMPRCEGPKKCYRLEPVPNAIATVLLGNDIDYPHGTVVRYTCQEGYTLTGHNERHCQNGEWGDIRFICAKDLVPKNCESLEPVPNAEAQVVAGNSIDYPHGTIVRYSCHQGYTLKGYNLKVCRNGVWSEVTFICQKEIGTKKCNSLEPVPGAIAQVVRGNSVDYPHGTVVRYTCQEGFTLTGYTDRHCQNGVWDEVKFNCTKKQETCNPPRDKFEIVNGIGSVERIENGSTIRLLCRWAWVSKDGIREASCINGDWRPKKPVCTVFCKLPRKGNRYFTYFESDSPVETSSVANKVVVVQHCRTPSSKSASTCTNGRWRPAFAYCASGRRLGKSIAANCTVPDNHLATFIRPSGYNLEPFEEVAHGDQIMQVCGIEAVMVVFNESRSSYCYGGRWLPDFQNCSNSSFMEAVHFADVSKCVKPEITFATLNPELAEYYVNETIVVHCHTGEELMSWNITCLETGMWSETNITCEAIGEEIKCPPPQKSSLVYWPLKKMYSLNETLTVLSCGEGLLQAGSSEMRCTTHGSWEGDFECLPACENGRIKIEDTNVHLPDQSRVNIEVMGFVGSVDDCARKCVASKTFPCKAIQVWTYIKNEEKKAYFCKCLSDRAENKSDKFVSDSSFGSNIYNVDCDNTCQLPTGEGLILTTINGLIPQSNESLPSGTVLKTDCNGTYISPEQRTITCIAGKWSIPQPYCAEVIFE